MVWSKLYDSMYMYLISLIMFLVGNMFFTKHKHLLIVLLSSKFIVLSFFFVTILFNNN